MKRAHIRQKAKSLKEISETQAGEGGKPPHLPSSDKGRRAATNILSGRQKTISFPPGTPGGKKEAELTLVFASM